MLLCLEKYLKKINGYKDGSVYTPGSITMYMARQSIRLAVMQKFRGIYGWKIEHFNDLKNYLSNQLSSNEVFIK